MVLLTIKRGNDKQFILQTIAAHQVKHVCDEILAIYNGRLKLFRICSEMEDLAKHGVMLPDEMIGLTDDQIEDLKLEDHWAEKCVPQGGWTFEKDPIGRRNGRQPNESMQQVLLNSIEKAKESVSNKSEDPLTYKIVRQAITELQGAVTIVYPMGLPPNDNIRLEFTNTEDLTGTQASKEVIEFSEACLWFAGRMMTPSSLLSDYLGKTENTKAVIKLTKAKENAPSREPVFTEQQKKEMQLNCYRRQQELEKLQNDKDDNYLNASWADSRNLKKQLNGLEAIKFLPNMRK